MPHVPSDPAADRLADWLRSRGGRVASLGVHDGPHGRGVFTLQPMREGEVIVRLPSSLCLTPAVAMETRSARVIHARWDGPAAGPIGLAAALLELRATRPPAWAAYLATLPARIDDHPTHLSLAERRALHGTSAASLLTDIDSRHSTEWRWLREEIPGFSKLTAATWTGARTLVTSRQFHFEKGGGTGLIPYADLFNHARHPEVTWTVDDEADVFGMRLTRDVPAGTELHVSYGTKSNLRMLLHYGFTVDDHAHDEALVDAPGLGSLVLPFAVDADAVAAVVGELGIGGQSPARQRRAWAQLEGILRRRLAGLPGPAPEGHPSKIHVDRLITGERAVLQRWAAHAQRLATPPSPALSPTP